MGMNKKAKIVIKVGLVSLLVVGVVLVTLFRGNISHQITVAGGKMTLASHKAELCDLTPNYTTPATYFDKITAFPAWKQVPRGFQVFNNVPLQIDGMICLWGEGNTKRHIVFPESIEGIEFSRRFESLYIYHTCFFEAPEGTPVYEVVFRYADGSSLTNEILSGKDVKDWGGKGKGPTGANSKLAWHTDVAHNHKLPSLRFCLTEIRNPRAAVEVKTVDLYSSKNLSAGCIHAMTTGKSGLMN